MLSNGVMKDLFAGVGGNSEAIAVNNAGLVVEERGSRPATFRACTSSQVSEMKLKLLKCRLPASVNAVNNAGQVVGCISDGKDGLACVSVNGTMVDLNSLVDHLSAWTLTRASGINDSGQIVGAGNVHGKLHAFLLTPIHENQNLHGERSPSPLRHLGFSGKANPQEGAARKILVLGNCVSKNCTSRSGTFV